MILSLISDTKADFAANNNCIQQKSRSAKEQNKIIQYYYQSGCNQLCCHQSTLVFPTPTELLASSTKPPGNDYRKRLGLLRVLLSAWRAAPSVAGVPCGWKEIMPVRLLSLQRRTTAQLRQMKMKNLPREHTHKSQHCPNL